jgi:glycosyltransferase involved in cell wall biosynthesis
VISVLILTKNEEQDLPACLESVAWSDDIHVYDSFSNDRTIEIATTAGALVTQRKFDNWSEHQNWGLQNIPFKHKWILYIDADERVSAELQSSLQSFGSIASQIVAFEIQRRDYAWDGTWLKHAQMSPYYLRLFQPSQMRYERLVNPISVPNGSVGRLPGFIDHYPFSKGIRYWWQRHLSYADLEAKMRLDNLHKGTKFLWIKALFDPEFSVRRYHQKGIFYNMPARPLIKWLYMVLWHRAFLDGSVGITYSTLQSIYEYFIVLKTREILNGNIKKK